MTPFSVCMAVYHGDKPTDLVTAVESIYQQQTLKPNEIILVVDGPVPAEMNRAIDKLKHNIGCMKVARFAENRGHAAARQAGIEAASNDVIALMDADDISLPNRFEKQIAFIETHPGIAVLGGQITEFVNSTSNVVGRRKVPLSHKEILAYIKKRCPFNQMTVILSRTQVLNAGGYQDWYCDEDYYLWTRMALEDCQFANLPDTLVNVRVGKEMYQRRGGWRYFKSEAKLQRYMLHHGVISLPRYLYNVAGRFAIQVAMPNSLRGFIFQRLFRE